MKAQWMALPFLSFLSLAAEAGQIKLCGTVLMPPGQTYAGGELTLETTLEAFSGGVSSSNALVTPLDPATNRYCAELDESYFPPADSFHVRMTIAKTASPSQALYTGNFTSWDDDRGEFTTQLSPSKDYNFYLDLIYLGASDPLDRKIFLPGLIPYTDLFEAQNKPVIRDTHANLNKITAVSYPEGNRVSDGSFEAVDSRWTILPTVASATALSVKPQHGNRALILNFPSSTSGHPVLSEPFDLKPATSYTLSFYYKSPEISGTIRPALVALANRSQNIQDGVLLPATGSYGAHGAWTLFTQTFTTPASAAFGRISLLEFNLASAGAGVIAFDNVVLVEGTSSPHEVDASTAFFDGLNRPYQSMQQVGETDIYGQMLYDEFGRKIITTLPIGFDYFRHNGRHAFLENLFDGPYGGHLNYYYGSPDPTDTSRTLDPNAPGPKAKGYPFTQTFYEASPLGRVTRSLLAGGHWRGATPNLDHDVRSYYGSVSGGQVNVNDAAALPLTSDIVPSDIPDHFLSVTQGENGEVSRSFTDLFGQETRRDNKFGNRWITTTSAYDALGNLVQETPPPGPNSQVVSRTMEYNSLSQPLADTSLDVGSHRSLYDRLGRLRFSQNSVQAKNGAFTYLKYDDLDRLIESGEYESATAYTVGEAEDLSFPPAGDPLRKVHVVNTYDSIPKILNVCRDGGSGIGEQIYIAAPNQPVPNGFFPDLNTAYEAARARFQTLPSPPSPVPQFLQFVSSQGDEIVPITGSEFTVMPTAGADSSGWELVGVPTDSAHLTPLFGAPFPFTVAWGPLQGRLTKTTVCNQALVATPVGLKEFSRYFNYDKYGNGTDVYEYNGYIADTTKQWQKVTSQYDVQNRLKAQNYFETAASGQPLFRFTYAYDAQERLDSISDESGHSVARPHYNLIGQMDSLKLGQPGPGQLTMAYQYHFQGWIQEITAKKASGDTLYHQRLKYEDGSAPRFDGSIGEYNYSLVQGATKRYLFGYDPLDRLTQGFTTLTSTSTVDGGTWGYQYADNGAISRMSNLNQAFQYVYVNGNQLDHVLNTGMPPGHVRSGLANFVYDAAGRMVVDESKGMDIDYDNTTGLASAFHVAGGSLVSSFYMAYDDQGMRVSKLEYQGSSEIAAKHYTGFGKEIRHSTPGWQEVYPFEGYGRKVKSSSGVWETESYVKNSLGSTVKVYNLAGSAESYSTDYEPFGKLRLQTVSTNAEVTPKFTGKEFDEGLELNYFGTRYYDPDIAVWISPDPTQEFFSPYTYSTNPINSIDPDGNSSAFVGGGPWEDDQSNAKLSYYNPNDGDNRAEFFTDYCSDIPYKVAYMDAPSPIQLLNEWYHESGPSTHIINSGTMLDDLMESPATKEALQMFRMGGPSRYALDFGPKEFLEASKDLSLTRHYLGSYRLDISRQDKNINLHFYNRTSLASATRNPGNRSQTALNARPRGLGTGGNTYQHIVGQLPF